MIRLLHFADTHLGMENYGRLNADSGMSTRIHDFAARMDEVVAHARDNDADLVIFAGDAFKNRQPNPTLQREFANRIRDLAALCPVVLLVGNHDLPSSEVRASSIEIYETLAVPNVLVGREFGVHIVETRNGSILVGTAPYPIRAQLTTPEETARLNMKQTEDLMAGRLSVLLSSLAEQAATYDMPRVLTGHFSIAEATLGSERGLMLGRDIAVPVSALADPAWDYVALGHIHKHQNLTQGRAGSPPVVYSGSLECIDFGEEGDRKGFCWAEIERGQTRWQFVPVHCRKFVSLYVDTRGLLDPMAETLGEINDHTLVEAVVKVIIQADEDQENLIKTNQIEAHLYNTARANYVAAIDIKIERAARARLGASPESLTPLQMVQRYFESKDTSPDQLADLLERAEALLSDDPV